MKIKDKIQNLPAWKALLLLVFLVLFLGMLIETVLFHTVFGVINNMITRIEIENKGDVKDLEEMDRIGKAMDATHALLREDEAESMSATVNTENKGQQ